MAGRHRVTLIPGDGIGPEVSAAATRLVLDAAHRGIEWVDASRRLGCPRDARSPAAPRRRSMRPRLPVAIKGPITTPVGTGFRSLNVALRQELDLFAAVRPVSALPGVPIRHPERPTSSWSARTPRISTRGSSSSAAHPRPQRSARNSASSRGSRSGRTPASPEADLGRRHPADRALRVRVRAAPTGATRSRSVTSPTSCATRTGCSSGRSWTSPATP